MSRFHLLLGAALLAVTMHPTAQQGSPGQPSDTEKPDTVKPESLALTTAETLEFTTDEVTWLSVDVSPDGRTLVFDLLGDLYTLPIDGGTATRIVGGLSFESQPTCSPDGKHIAFLSDRTGVENLWMADADGANPRAVSKDGRTATVRRSWCRPAWTPDGQYIVVSKSRPPDPGTFWLFMYHRDGGNGVRVGAAPPPQPGPDAPPGPPPPPPAEPHGRGGVTRRPLHLLRAAHRHLHLQRALPAVADPPPRSRDRRSVAGDQRPGQRDAAGCSRRTASGWSTARATRPRPGLRVRNLETGAERWLVLPVTRDDQESRASRDTLPALRLPARRQVARRADRRQAAAHGLRHGAARADPVHGAGAGRDRRARLHAGARRRRRPRCGRG